MQRKISVTQSNGRQVEVRHLCEGLMVCPGISHLQEMQLLEDHLDLVSESSRSEAASFSIACWPGFLEDGVLTSAGFPMATMARAASRSLSQVLFRFVMQLP
jgi:hypothetical protein